MTSRFRHGALFTSFLLGVCLFVRYNYWTVQTTTSFSVCKWTLCNKPVNLEDMIDPGFGQMLNRSRSLDFGNRDVLVFLHMQKTGGTLLESDMLAKVREFPCYSTTLRSYRCPRKLNSKDEWLEFRYTSPGWPCGVHPDISSLRYCVSYRRQLPDDFLHYTTILRDPVNRFLSEYRHVGRGGTWEKQKHVCIDYLKLARNHSLKMCYKLSTGSVLYKESFRNVTLDQFLTCDANMAINRQVRMLATWSPSMCRKYFLNGTLQARELLESAKRNLQSMSYFALYEQLPESIMMFQRTFQFSLTKPIELTDTSYASIYRSSLTQQQLQRIINLNYLDIMLYKFAKKLFLERLRYIQLKFGLEDENLQGHKLKTLSPLVLNRLEKNMLRNSNSTMKKKRKKKNGRRWKLKHP